jgi:diguanylate cyclase (GGDEF)-like protein
MVPGLPSTIQSAMPKGSRVSEESIDRVDEVPLDDQSPDERWLPPMPSGWTDQLTGTDGPRFWDRILTNELSRARRYSRPVTIVLVELSGLDRFAGLWGVEVAGRIFVATARTLAVEVRSSDHIARVDRTRFAILLTETDEIAAINFVERARAACEASLDTAAGSARIGFGWASPSASIDLPDALDIAERRLAHELESTT